MNLPEFVQIVQGVRDDCQREEDQGLLQHDLHKAEMALAGKYVCDRILRALGVRAGLRLVDPKNAGRAR